MTRSFIAVMVIVLGISTFGMAAKGMNANAKLIEHEFLIGGPGFSALGGLLGGSTIGTSQFTFSSDITAINASVGYNYSIVPMFQIGGRTGISYNSLGGASFTLFQFLAGPTFNLIIEGFNEKNAFFLDGYAGITTINNGVGTKFTFGFDVGKRLPIGDHFVYRPMVGIQKMSDFALAFSIYPLSFSVVF